MSLDPLADDDPEGSLQARLVGFGLLIAVPASVAGFFVAGGRRDCAISPDAFVCSAPDAWALLAVTHAVALLAILALAVVGSQYLIGQGNNPSLWAALWGILAVVVRGAVWWFGSA